jgi:hypothetical protein
MARYQFLPRGSGRCDLVYGRSIARSWHRLVQTLGSSQPRGLGLLDLGQSLLRRTAECRTGLKVRNIGDVSAIFFAVEDVDVIVLHCQELSAIQRVFLSRAYDVLSACQTATRSRMAVRGRESGAANLESSIWNLQCLVGGRKMPRCPSASRNRVPVPDSPSGSGGVP